MFFPVILLSTGLILETRFEKKREVEEHLSKTNFTTIIYYGMIGFVGILITGVVVQYIHLPSTFAISSPASVAYGWVEGIGEEQFFRGFLLDMTLTIIPKGNMFANQYFLCFVNGAIFMVFHWAVYGTQPAALLYVLVGGTILALINVRTKRLSPAMLAHGLANIVAVLGGVI